MDEGELIKLASNPETDDGASDALYELREGEREMGEMPKW